MRADGGARSRPVSAGFVPFLSANLGRFRVHSSALVGLGGARLFFPQKLCEQMAQAKIVLIGFGWVIDVDSTCVAHEAVASYRVAGRASGARVVFELMAHRIVPDISVQLIL